ncbi:hypothetical protein SprV_0501922200 [Sparganum proliferum]
MIVDLRCICSILSFVTVLSPVSKIKKSGEGTGGWGGVSSPLGLPSHPAVRNLWPAAWRGALGHHGLDSSNDNDLPPPANLRRVPPHPDHHLFPPSSAGEDHLDAPLIASLAPAGPCPRPEAKPAERADDKGTRSTKIDDEVACRISKASQAFGRLQNTFWDQHGLRFSTKLQMYKTVIRPTLLC